MLHFKGISQNELVSFFYYFFNVKSIYMNNKTLKFFLLLGILGVCFFLGRFFNVDVDYYRELLNRYPLFLSGFIFIALYIILTSLIWFGPKDILRISSAVLYGPYVSTVLVFLSEMGNAFLLFMLSRALGQDYVATKFKIKTQDLERQKKDKGFFGAFTLRINPFIPFRLQDLGAGLSQISFRKYLAAIVIASPLRILWLQYILAGVGMSLFKDPDFLLKYLLGHHYILICSSAYFLFIIIVTITYMVTKSIQNRKIKKQVV